MELQEQQETHHQFQRNATIDPLVAMRNAGREVATLNDRARAELVSQRATSMALRAERLSLRATSMPLNEGLRRHRQARQEVQDRIPSRRLDRQTRDERLDRSLVATLVQMRETESSRRARHSQSPSVEHHSVPAEIARNLLAPTPAASPQASAERFQMIELTHEPGDQCSICLEAIVGNAVGIEEKPVELPCKHHFHRFCITSWLATRPTCPLCRVAVPRME